MQSATRPSLRVAIEGCGHGKLHDIYSSVADAAEKKGWDGVDLLIIGGDFQAVRNSNDLACMAVPPKYKTIGDFHEYYSGARVAPYLTVFIGGNHEASNYLFELYYGGWVAPNIYYLGAANVIRCGPFRIAGMSGIWKGYDYQKPHFERLPYDYDAQRSIYHTREIDVRKLLQVRTQVDIGLSHDWPQGVEWTGDFQSLFTRKPLFADDAETGRLGSVAAKYVLDRLRPTNWFSAHLHCKYASTVEHGEYVAATPTPWIKQGPLQRLPQLTHNPNSGNEVPAKVPTEKENKDQAPENAEPKTSSKDKRKVNDRGDQAKINAWNDFHTVAAKNEKEEHEKYMQRASEYHKQVEAGTIKPGSDINYQVTWRKVGITDDGLGREVQEVIKSETKDSQVAKEEAAVEVKNADEIDIDLDGMSDDPQKGETKPDSSIEKKDTPAQVKNADEIDIDVDTSEDDSSKVEPKATSSTEESAVPVKQADEMSVDIEEPNVKPTTPSTVKETAIEPESKPEENITKPEDGSARSGISDKYDIPDDLRDQLPESFRKAKKAKITPIIDTALPDRIKNSQTEFLALDKCDRNREFIQLMELHPVGETDEADMQRPYQLKYDKEWLAITRVLAEGFEVGNDKAPIPKNKGDGGYKADILASEAWVEENVVKPGKMTVPQNFSITAPVYDESVPILTYDQPPEYLNPQTAEFCELIGIENKFSMTEDQRQVQLEAIAKSNEQGDNRNNARRGHHHGGGRGNRGGRRGRGWGRRGRGRGGFAAT